MVKGVHIACHGPRTVSGQAVSMKTCFSTTSNAGASTHVKLVPVLGG